MVSLIRFSVISRILLLSDMTKRLFNGDKAIKLIKHKTLTIIDSIDGLVEDCDNSSALVMELLQSCAKPSLYGTVLTNAV